MSGITDNSNMYTSAWWKTHNASYAYDGLGQLKTAWGWWGQADYDYDALGNLLSRDIGAAYLDDRLITAQYDINNRLSVNTDSLALSGGGTGTRYLGYDARGNITSLGQLAMSYDMTDQAVGVSGQQPNGTPVSGWYEYNGEGKRVRANMNGRDSYFVYDAGGQLSFIYKTVDYESVDMIRLANGHTLAKSTNHAFTYLHTDHLGTPLRGTTHLNSGASVFQEYYTPFGLNPTAGWNGDTGTGFTAPGFMVNSNLHVTGLTGHPKDEGTGLTYMQARHYDPALGRFLSIDPVTFMDTGNPSQFNRYAYTFNDPINLIDPDGENPAVPIAKHVVKKQVKSSLKKRLLSSGANFEKVEAAIDLSFAAMDGPGALVSEAASIGVDKFGGKVVEKAKDAVKSVKKFRKTRSGDTAVEITSPDGTVTDISPTRVKQATPNTHPSAPEGAMQKTKFEDAQPGSKGYKRDPTPAELKELE